MPSRTDAILLTGATGFLGGEILQRLLSRTDREVFAVVRRPLGLEHPRLHEIHADISAEALPLPLPEQISTVIHCAASVHFDRPIAEQRAINVDGTRRILDAARTLPHLERVMHVSTAYVAGTHEGVFGPGDLDRGQGFRNTYEQSKFEAEQLVAQSGLPVQVIRPSIIVGDQHEGRTTSFNVVYMPLRAYSRGLMQIAPGRPAAPVDVVPVDYVADAMLALLQEPPGDTHVLAAGDRAATVGEFIGLAAERFGREPATVMEPGAITQLIAGLPENQRDAATRALESAEELLPYFDVRCNFEDPRTVAALERYGLRVPRLRDYFDRLIDYAERTRWGKAQRRADERMGVHA